LCYVSSSLKLFVGQRVGYGKAFVKQLAEVQINWK